MSKRKTSDSSSKKLVQQKLTGIFTSTKRDKATTEEDTPKKKFKQTIIETSEREKGQPDVAINEVPVAPHKVSTSTPVRVLDESEDEISEGQDDVEALMDDDNTVSHEVFDVENELEELPRDRVVTRPKLSKLYHNQLVLFTNNIRFYYSKFFFLAFHDEDYKSIDKLLHAFDLNYRFGPCIGLTRLERWERAHKLGLNPPEEVKRALTSEAINPELNECVFYGRV
jgi:DNA polymerase delta subunit 4